MAASVGRPLRGCVRPYVSGRGAGRLGGRPRDDRTCAALPFAAAAAATRAPETQAAEAPVANSAEDLPKNFDPRTAEARLYALWEEEGCFRPSPTSAAPLPPFTIPMPPPNVTGRLHMGHAMFVALQDVMARYRRMRGHPTLWLPGTDHAGIATQLVVEKDLAAKPAPPPASTSS